VCESRNVMKVNVRIHHIVRILQLLIDQFSILETMTPLDFYDFRDYLSTASGLLEIKLGVCDDQRVLCNRKQHRENYTHTEQELLHNSEKEHTLLGLVQTWLETTPGLEEDGFNFLGKLRVNVSEALRRQRQKMENKVESELEAELVEDMMKQSEMFTSLFDEKKHNQLLCKGTYTLHTERLLYKALQGALMIYFYKEEPQFQLLTSLMDLDTLMTKWR
ncbi:hypothetical protein QTP70_025642, partial [Hemibagrus guttatus]